MSKTVVLTAGAQNTFPASGNFIFVASATGTFAMSIRMINGNDSKVSTQEYVARDRIPLPPGYSLKEITLVDKSSATNTIVLRISDLPFIPAENEFNLLGSVQVEPGGAPIVVAGPLTDTELRATAVPVSGPLTDTELRATAVPVSGPLTDTQLRATAVPVSGPLTDTELRATAVPVSGPLTDTQLRATAVPVSGPLTDTELRATAVPVSGPLTDTQLRATPVDVSIAGVVSTSTSPISFFHLVSAAGNNATNIKASAGKVRGWTISNIQNVPQKVAFHDTSGTPTAGTGVVAAVLLPAHTISTITLPNGMAFASGIAITTTGLNGDSDTTAVAVNVLSIDIYYE